MDSTIIGAIVGVFGLLTAAYGFFFRGAAADRRELAAERAERKLVEKDLDREQALRLATQRNEAMLQREVDRLNEIIKHLTQTKGPSG